MQAILIWLLVSLSSYLADQSYADVYQPSNDTPASSDIQDSATIEIMDKPVSSESASIVYKAIDRQCGSCHQGTHSTNKQALAIFNLADECWYCKLTPDQAAGVIRRTRGSSFSTEEQDAIKSLVEKLATKTE